MPSGWCAILGAGCCAIAGVATMAGQYNPVANSKMVVTSGHARFTVLTPALVRMEWSPDAQFEDRASLAFIHRTVEACHFDVQREGKRLTLATDRLSLTYVDDGRPFHSGNLQVQLRVNGQPVTWQPGMAADGNLRGTTRTLDGVSGSCPLEPGILSRDGWAIVDDSSTPVFVDGYGSWVTERKRTDSIDWYFFGYGHKYKLALRDYTRISGSIPLPPRYAFGSWWSRYWAYTDDELKQLVTEFKQHDVPLDVLVVDMDWHLDGWTGYTWNPAYFPDPEKFLDWVREQGLRTTLNLHPADGVAKHEAAFADMARALGKDPEKRKRIEFDCTDPEYMETYFKHLHRPLERQGVDFWWIDWQQGEKTDIRGLDPLWWLNHLHWQDMQRRATDADSDRPLIFSRWGGLGNHRYPIGFSGDTYSNWKSLAFQPYFTATAGNVGFGYWSHDIGGHQPGPVDAELYVRWIQFGAFSPILRTHTTKHPEAERRIWKLPERHFAASRMAFKLRYALLPYIYTAARKCHDTSVPLCRPLYYDWPELDEAYTRRDQYMFGDDVLVAPVVTPQNTVSRIAERRVWLPPGTWTHWFTRRTYKGPREIMTQVPLEEIPLFVREGAVIPATPDALRAGTPPSEVIEWHMFPGESGIGRLYEDDGTSVGYLRGKVARTQCRYTRENKRVHIDLSGARGEFTGLPDRRLHRLLLHDTVVESVSVDGVALDQARTDNRPGWYRDSQTWTTVINLPAGPASKSRHVLVTCKLTLEEQRETFDGLYETVSIMDNLCAQLSGITDCSTYRSIVSSLRDQYTSGHLPVDDVRKLHAQRWTVASRIADNELPESVRRSWQLRLLGVVCRLQIEGVVNRGGVQLAVDCEQVAPEQVLRGSSGTIPAQMTVRLDKPEHWQVKGEADGVVTARGTSPGIRTRIDMLPNGLPQTTTVSGEATYKYGDTRLDIPLSLHLLPSINHWWIVGPFDAGPDGGLSRVYPPEASIDLTATYEGKGKRRIGWQRVSRNPAEEDDPSDEFHVDFFKVFGESTFEAVAYALTYLHAPDEIDARLALGSDDGVVVWLNGQEVHRNDVGRAYTPKEDQVSIRLKRGTNTLLLKINQGGGMWSFAAHIEDNNGQPLTAVTAGFKP